MVHGNGGQDQLALDGNYTATLDARADVETVVLLAGPADDRNTFHLTAVDDFVAAGATKTVFGVSLTQGMTLDASAESDGALKVYGGHGADTVTGGAGDDWIFGGEGADLLTGGAGSDTFFYDDIRQSTADARDTITDFASADIVDLSRIDADPTSTADDAFTLIGTAAFSHHAGELRWDTGTDGQVVVQGDVDGDGLADFVLGITIADHHAFGANDLHL